MLLTILILFFGRSYTQNKLNGQILDYETKRPIEYADIYNSKDFTSSNSDGKFWFQSVEDSIHIRLLGYETIHSTFENLKKDRIYLNRKLEFLDEVILSEQQSIKSVHRNIYKNYFSQPFTESFFLRCVLKKNGEIIKLQDLSGLVGRKTLFSTPQYPMPRKNYSVRIDNMRKASIENTDISFELFSFEEFFAAISSIDINTEDFNFNEINYEDGQFLKYNFSPKDVKQLSTKGYYLVNKEDNATQEFYSINTPNRRNFEESRGVKYRTVHYELYVSFKKNYTKQKYFIDKAKLRAKVEAVNKDRKTFLYEAEYLWIVLRQTYRNIENHIPLDKDIFTLTIPYNEQFWEAQNNLLLTDEMLAFLEGLEDTDHHFNESKP